MPANLASLPTVQELKVLHQHLTTLATLPETDTPILSIFLDLYQPLDGLRAKFAHWAVSARIAIRHEQRPSFDAARAQVDSVLRQEWSDSLNSLAIFARAGTAPLLTVMPFRATMENYFHVDSLPSIFPLVQLKDRFHRFVVAICTEETSKIFEITLGSVSEEILATRPEIRQRVGREWTREHYHQSKRENDRRFLKDQAELISNLMAKRGHNHLILAGHPRTVSALRNSLPKEIEARVADTIDHCPNGTDYSITLEQAISAFIEVEQQESQNTVQRLNEQFRRGGLACIGSQATRTALGLCAASELVISQELPIREREEFVKAATFQEIPIEVCEGDELLNHHGGVGCLLRYRVDFATVS